MHDPHFYKAGERLWNTGLYTLEQAQSWGRQQGLSMKQMSAMLAGRAAAEKARPLDAPTARAVTAQEAAQARREGEPVPPPRKPGPWAKR